MAGREQSKLINGIQYVRWPYGDSNPVWRPDDSNDPAPFVCPCGGTEFNVYSGGAYSTMVKCTKCGNTDEVHSG